MKYLFKRDTILATISVFLVMGILAIIPLNTHLLDPLKLALSDIHFNDLSFSELKSHRANPVDDKVVIINIGEADREGIAALLNKVAGYKAKAIGLDVLFLEGKVPRGDSLLAVAIKNTPNLVLSDKISWEADKLNRYNYFNKYADHRGYVNFVGEEKGVIRYFSPFEEWKGTANLSFAASIAQLADKEKYAALEKRGYEVELINYQRQVDQFFIVNDTDLIADRVDTMAFAGKVVIMGYINNDPNNIEDKHFTPLNEKFVGKSIPDMNGVVIQANIVSMILNEQYINRMPGWVSWTMSGLLAWIFVAFSIKNFIEKHLWFHLKVKLIQLVVTILFIYLGIMCYRHLHISMDFTATLAAIVLSVDVLYFYEAFAKWMHKKYGFQTIFSMHH